jgi:hypothetical protein
MASACIHVVGQLNVQERVMVCRLYKDMNLDELWVERQKCAEQLGRATNWVDMICAQQRLDACDLWLERRQAKVAPVHQTYYLEPV